jgi:hypothetical protein
MTAAALICASQMSGAVGTPDQGGERRRYSANRDAEKGPSRHRSRSRKARSRCLTCSRRSP